MFGHEADTNGWADDRWRRLARDLHALADQAAHDEPLSDRDADRAVAIAAQFRALHRTVEGQTRRFHPYAAPRVAGQQPYVPERRVVTEDERDAARERWLMAAQQWITIASHEMDARHSYAQALLATAEKRVERATQLLAFLDHQWPSSNRDPSALFYRAGALVYLDRYEEAATLAREAVHADDSLRGAWALLAWTSTMMLADFQTGERAARRLLREEPDNQWAVYMLGEALSGQGRNDELADLYDDT